MALRQIFVYGTLKKGHRNHYILEHNKAKQVAQGFITNFRLWDMPRWRFPLLTNYPQGDKVWGELYVVDERHLAGMDAFENGYARRPVKFVDEGSGGQEPYTVEAYVWQRELPEGALWLDKGRYQDRLFG